MGNLVSNQGAVSSSKTALASPIINSQTSFNSILSTGSTNDTARLLAPLEKTRDPSHNVTFRKVCKSEYNTPVNLTLLICWNSFKGTIALQMEFRTY